MAKTNEFEAILELLPRESRAVADEFILAAKSGEISWHDAPVDRFVVKVPEPQRDTLRRGLNELVLQANKELSGSEQTTDDLNKSKLETSQMGSDATLVHEPRDEAAPPQGVDSPNGSDATIDPSEQTPTTPTDASEETLIHTGNSAQSTDQAEYNPDATVDLPAKSLPGTPDDVTVNLSGLGLPSGLDATIDPTSQPTNPQRDQHFSWDPSGVREAPRGDLPTVDGYEILGELGRGGMGVVYRARQRGLNRIVALKMILAGGHAGGEQLDRFRAEAEAVALLQHPNIVQIYDVGERDGLPFFALEFIDGQALDELIDGQPQTPKRSAEIVEKLAHAMHYSHEQGIVHRDLKPANILLSRDGDPKVTDFGLVKRLEADSSQTRTGTIMGTPSFMAPEQARGERQIGPPADTYALGALLYAMLTGRPPFMGPTALDTVMMVIKNEPLPPSRMQPQLPKDIEVICLKCLQKEPEKRYESAGALAEDLRRYLAGEPILARSVGRTERIWRWCRRNPTVATLSASAMLLGLILMIGGPIAAVLINVGRNEALAARAAAEKSASAARQAESQALTAQNEAESARKVADANAEIAKTQRQLALSTLSDVVTRVEEELRDRSELNDLRQKVLSLAMKGLENVSRSAETANFADRTIGAAHQRMGDIMLRAGKADDAREQYGKALAIFEKLMDAPEHDLVQWNAALTHDGLGDVSRQQLDDASIAREHYEIALNYRLGLIESVTSPKLKPFMIRASLANSYGRLSLLWLEQIGDPLRAAAFSEKAIEQSEALLKDLPDHPVAKQAIAGAWNLYADALMRTSRIKEAADFAEKARELRETLLEADPESVKSRQDMAISDWMLGDIALYSERPNDALKLYENAHEIRLELHEQDPENPEMQEDLAKSHYRLGIARLSLHETPDAMRSFEACEELLQKVLEADPENSTKRLMLLQAQSRTNQHLQAAAAADELRSQLAETPGSLLRLAGIYATSVQTAALAEDSQDVDEGFVERTMASASDALRLAIAGGYRDAFNLSKHPDLEGIRSSAAFADILSQASANDELEQLAK